jgi:ATP-dependent DNA ligase
VYEEKYDGWRILAYKGEGQVQLLSRNGHDHARRFDEVVRAIAALRKATLILDGEVAIFDEQLISRFEWLRPGTRESLSTPPIYMAFDVLQAGNQDLRNEPLRTRRKVLCAGTRRALGGYLVGVECALSSSVRLRATHFLERILRLADQQGRGVRRTCAARRPTVR